MSKKQVTVEKVNKSDSMKWSAVIALLIAAVAAHYYFATTPWPIKIIGWIVVLLIAVFTLKTTVRGQWLTSFAKESRVELQKVVWPTRKEAGQITMIVILVVFVAGIFLWGVDTLLVWCVGKITQLKG